MADFWIKVEKGTPDKPEILELSGILNIADPDTITGKMIRVWAWFDSNSENGHAPSVTNVLIDRLTGVTGFTSALVDVGWLEETDDGFVIPNFDRHLGKNAKKRASDAERKRMSRNKSRECHNKTVTEIGLDKSRVDKSRDKETIVANAPLPAKAEQVPYQQILELYREILVPIGMTNTLKLTDKRKSKMRSFWKKSDMDLDKLRCYFLDVYNNCKWFGERRPKNDGSGQFWNPRDLEFLMSEEVMVKVAEGRY